MDVNRIFSAEQIAVPPDLPLLLKEWTKDVIRNSPEDLALFSLQWFKARADENRRGSLSADDLETIRKLFEQYDVDGNGKMEARELKSFIVQDLGLDISDNDLDAVVALLDTDNSGFLDFNEIMKWYCGQV
ncbi:unnamed protein product [Aphanomyces euteiches]|uniref:EF-hand domain-containing protein n=1 Tax=Aphanomyces euteiches TaxID=100861 RepID=A0A6G0XXW0_9STRA|nr:hypothetical protein Ae201684_000034 [Aphanomyces euteiches]KAH9083236.1 hypothetical protein LEN26_021047 [Aphanomyces euteiches]KAH9091462.1 hypothetical protein Ae201684P_011007 [Aphanomyces euteiches]KAH9123420.1 hypothetical protein AeMF1_005581 [Aphanomyces euteiches]KAH9181899.1 hypothetical protein AeNC1_016124 [Aphanomyces euteiches]